MRNIITLRFSRKHIYVSASSVEAFIYRMNFLPTFGLQDSLSVGTFTLLMVSEQIRYIRTIALGPRRHAQGIIVSSFLCKFIVIFNTYTEHTKVCMLRTVIKHTRGDEDTEESVEKTRPLKKVILFPLKNVIVIVFIFNRCHYHYQ